MASSPRPADIAVRSPQELTPDERKSGLPITIQMTPLTMTLRVVSRPKFEAEWTNADRSRNMAISSASEVGAFTYSYRHPCEIVIPANWLIGFIPDPPLGGPADFLDYNNARTLAHEIAHCYRGAWHDNPRD